MKIYVDADACPVKEIIVKLARKHKVKVVMVADTSHQIDDGYSEVITVEKSRDSADLKIANLVAENDLVVTQDYGVAAMALAKKAKVINQNGLIFTEYTIEALLTERHINQQVRKTGGRMHTVKKRTLADNKAFTAAFLNILQTK